MRVDEHRDEESSSTNNEIKRRSILKSIGVLGAGATGGGAGLTLTAPIATASGSSTYGTTVIENFEDSDLTEYSIDRDPSGASIVSSPTLSGSYSLEVKAANTELLSTSGLDFYPSAGDTFGCWVQGVNGAAALNFTYGGQDENNRYVAKLNFQNDSFILHRYENGTLYNLAAKWSGIVVEEDEWYHIEIQWGTDGSHVCSLFEKSGSKLCEISSNDTTWQDGGVGYDAYLNTSGGSVYFDYVTKEGLDGVGGGGNPQPISGDVVVEGFEDASLDNYDFDRGKPGASIVSSSTHTGSHALEISDDNTEMLSNSLESYPSAGDELSCWFNATSSGGANHLNFSYGGQDPKNRYIARINYEIGVLKFFRYENGSLYLLARSYGEVQLNDYSWYEIRIEWGVDGTHVVSYYDDNGNEIKSISAVDSTWVAGNVGFDAYNDTSGESARFDTVQVRPTVANLMSESIEDSNNKIITSPLGSQDIGYELYVAKGCESYDEIPDKLVKITSESYVGPKDLQWDGNGAIRYWHDDGNYTRTIDSNGVISEPIRMDGATYPKNQY